MFRSKSFACLGMRSVDYIKFLPGRAAQCRDYHPYPRLTHHLLFQDDDPARSRVRALHASLCVRGSSLTRDHSHAINTCGTPSEPDGVVPSSGAIMGFEESHRLRLRFIRRLTCSRGVSLSTRWSHKQGA